MQRIRYGFMVLAILLCSVTSAAAEVSIGIWAPPVSIGINVPLYPTLVPVPGYPVYYAPRLHGNYFFYDGMYWVFEDDDWYASYWYNGPWWFVEPYDVPVFILRIPVRYYMLPPVYFREWYANAPPRWGQHWGPEWEEQRRGWDRWQRRSVPRRAPLPLYQRQYSGERYPRQVEEQNAIRSQHYRYQPRDKAVREHFRQQLEQGAPAPAQRERRERPGRITPRQRDIQPSRPFPQGAPDGRYRQPMHRGGENFQRSAPAQPPPPRRGPAIQEQRRQPDAVQREQQAPRFKNRGKEEEPGPNRDRGPGQGPGGEEEPGRGRNY